MILKVHPHIIEIEKNPVNEKEVNITKCEFIFDEEITNDFVKEAYFTLNGRSYKQIIENNECDIPQEVLVEKGTIEVGVSAFIIEDETILKRYNPSPVYFSTLDGSIKQAENSQPITPSEFERFEQELQEGLNQVANVDIDAVKVGNKATVSITNRNAETKNVDIYDGDSGITVFKIEGGHLIATSENGTNLTNYSLEDDGHLYLTIEEV